MSHFGVGVRVVAGTVTIKHPDCVAFLLILQNVEALLPTVFVSCFGD